VYCRIAFVSGVLVWWSINAEADVTTSGLYSLETSTHRSPWQLLLVCIKCRFMFPPAQVHVVGDCQTMCSVWVCIKLTERSLGQCFPVHCKQH